MPMKSERLFVDTPAGRALAGVRCGACGTISFPVRQHCPACLDERVEVQPLARHGRLFAFTTAEVGMPGLEPPYAFGFVDLPEGVRVFSLLERGSELRAGMTVDLVVPDGEPRYRFAPAVTTTSIGERGERDA